MFSRTILSEKTKSLFRASSVLSEGDCEVLKVLPWSQEHWRALQALFLGSGCLYPRWALPRCHWVTCGQSASKITKVWERAESCLTGDALNLEVTFRLSSFPSAQFCCSLPGPPGPCSPEQGCLRFVPGEIDWTRPGLFWGIQLKACMSQGCTTAKDSASPSRRTSLMVDIPASKMPTMGTLQVSALFPYLRKHSGIWEAYSKSSSYFWKCSSNSLSSLWLVGQMPFPNRVFTTAGYMTCLQGWDPCDLQEMGELLEQP